MTDDDGDAVVEELTVSVSDVAARMLVSGPAATNEGEGYRLSLVEIDDAGNDPIQCHAKATGVTDSVFAEKVSLGIRGKKRV